MLVCVMWWWRSTQAKRAVMILRKEQVKDGNVVEEDNLVRCGVVIGARLATTEPAGTAAKKERHALTGCAAGSRRTFEITRALATQCDIPDSFICVLVQPYAPYLPALLTTNTSPSALLPSARSWAARAAVAGARAANCEPARSASL